VPGNANRDYQTGAVFNGPKSAEFDRFILSPSQYALVLYATLVEVGRMAPEGLQQFNQDGSSVEMIGAEHSPGMEVMTGSLGQGLSQAAGLAMARKRRGERGRVWVFMSDGELQSGQNWEAMQAIAFHQLDNLRIIVDVNQQQCDGAVAQVMQTEPLDQRLAAFGARVRRIDGHNIEQLAEMAELEPDGRALVILADTDPCAGIELLQARAPKLHYIRFSSPGEQQAFAAALAEF
jgi:transketolase